MCTVHDWQFGNDKIVKQNHCCRSLEMAETLKSLLLQNEAVEAISESSRGLSLLYARHVLVEYIIFYINRDKLLARKVTIILVSKKVSRIISEWIRCRNHAISVGFNDANLKDICLVFFSNTFFREWFYSFSKVKLSK